MVNLSYPYLLLLCGVGGQRLVELIWSRRNERAARAQGAREHAPAQLWAMACLHGGLLASCGLEVVVFQRPFLPALGYPALVVLGLAAGLRLWAIASLGPRWTVRILVWPSHAVITRGPYRLLRHPNYLAVVMEVAALPLVHGAFLTAALFSLLNALVLSVRIRAEEEALGAAYAQSFHHVPRFLPRLQRR